MNRVIWVAVALVTLARAIAAFAIPLTGDEAYYWEWSRRLAFGYVDHPPMVAWTIAAFAWIGHAPGFVRFGFVLCGAVTALALSAATVEITANRRAGAVAALALTLTPLATVVFVIPSPDGPYLMFWALALWFAARAFRRDRIGDWLLLGAALGGVLLSRVLGFALLFGLVAYSLSGPQRAAWRRGMPLMLATAFIVVLPFLVWNANHDWVTFSFALLYRHEEKREFSTLNVLLAQLVAYSPGIWAAAIACAVRRRNALLAWTALPQFILVMLLSLFERVEISWIFGFFVSLCAMLGIAYVALEPRARAIWTWVAAAPATLLLVVLFTFIFAPAATYKLVLGHSGARLRNGGPFEIMTYAPVARDAAMLARKRDAIVMTDGYGFSSVIDFDAGVTPVVIGYDWQGREARGWYADSNRPRNALFVDKEPLSSRTDFETHLRRACTKVVDGGVRGYSYKGTGRRDYYFTWCEGLRPDGLAILRWERKLAQSIPTPSAAAKPSPTQVPFWQPADRDEVRRELASIFGDAIFADDSGLAVLTLDGTPLYLHRAGSPLTPASTLKLVVAATALDVLGPKQRFTTSFVALDGPDAAGVIHGPLWLVGGGDPLFTSNDLRGGVGTLRRLGVTRIEGPLIVDDGAFAGPEQNPRWDPDDLQEGYAAATSAISLDQGTVEFHVTPGTIGRAARVTIEPPNDTVEIDGSITSGYATDLTIDRRPDRFANPLAARNAFSIAGTVGPGEMLKYWKPVLGIPAYVGGATVALLAQQGIEVSGGTERGSAPLAAQTLWAHRSQPLSAIVGEMLVHSNNHSAEQLLRILGGQSRRDGATVRRPGTDAAGLAVERAELRRLGVATPRLRAYDGSGLAPDDKIAPLALAQLLAAELRGPNAGIFVRSLPRVGMEGTVQYHDLHAALGRARAKSGHLLHVNGLAGTVLTRMHGRIVFAFLTNDPRSESRVVYRAQDRALDTLAKF